MTAELKKFFEENPKVAMAFSGGTDSAYLLYTGVSCGADIRPYYIKSCFQPDFELEDAKKLARQLNVELHILDLDILSVPHVASNPPDRCYYCKRAMFGRMVAQAKQDGYDLIIDGTNASDNASERPGLRVLREMGVRSPLREAGLSKDDIRNLSNRINLFTWNKPAYACLSTRIAPGEQITKTALSHIELSEAFLSNLGFTDFRVRVKSRTAKLQLKESQMEHAIRNRDKILSELSKYFSSIVLDMEGR